MAIERQPGDPPDSGLPLKISDSRHSIMCRITPTLLSKFAAGAFAKHTIIDITSLCLKIACTFDFVYLLVHDCPFSASLQLLPVLEADNRQLADINKHRVVRDAVAKFRVAWSIEFLPSPDERDPDTSTAADADSDSGWDFNQEVGTLSGTLPAHEPHIFDGWGQGGAALDDEYNEEESE